MNRSTLVRLAALPLALLVLGAAVPSAPAQDSRPGVAAPAGPATFPDDWFFQDRRNGGRYAKPKELEGKPAPELKLEGWLDKNKPADLAASMKGRIVVVDFWGTWCPPCRAALPKNQKLWKDYTDRKEPVLMLGVHDARRGADQMAKMATDMGLEYPMAVDVDSVSAKAWNVSFWPTYIVLDQKGIVRAAGLRPDKVGDVVEALLAEMKAGKGGA